MCCCIQFARILLRILGSVFLSDIGLQFSLWCLCLVWYQDDGGLVEWIWEYSSLSFWNTFGRIGSEHLLRTTLCPLHVAVWVWQLPFLVIVPAPPSPSSRPRASSRITGMVLGEVPWPGGSWCLLLVTCSHPLISYSFGAQIQASCHRRQAVHKVFGTLSLGSCHWLWRECSAPFVHVTLTISTILYIVVCVC